MAALEEKYKLRRWAAIEGCMSLHADDMIAYLAEDIDTFLVFVSYNSVLTSFSLAE